MHAPSVTGSGMTELRRSQARELLVWQEHEDSADGDS